VYLILNVKVDNTDRDRGDTNDRTEECVLHKKNKKTNYGKTGSLEGSGLVNISFSSTVSMFSL